MARAATDLYPRPTRLRVDSIWGTIFHFGGENISIEATDTIAARAGTPYSWHRAFLLVAFVATAAVTPMFFLGAPSGHDFQFHLASWGEVLSQWRQGLFYPRWAEWANWGYGEPRFIFYPPASWMLGAALDSVFPWVAAPVVYIWLALVAGGMAMWRLAREWLSPPEASAAGIFFAVNPYNIVVVYYRSDFAELLATALFPLLILGILRIMRQGWPPVPFLAVIFAGIWLSNAPAAVIATYSAALLLLVGAVLARSFRPLLLGGTAMAAGLGLAAFYVLPAAWERKWVQIAQAVSENLRPEQNFIFTHASDPEFLWFNWRVSSLALGVMLVTGILAVFVARRRRELGPLWWMLAALGACSTMLMFSPSKIFWRFLPELRFVQFPWRWLEILGVVFALFTAAATRSSRRQWALWFAILALLGATATAIARDTWWDSDDPSTIAEWVRSGDGYEGTDEYAPVGCDRYRLPGVNSDPTQPPANPVPLFAKFDFDSGAISPGAGVRLHVEKWTAEQRFFSGDGAATVELALRIVSYPAWEAQVDGRMVKIAAAPNTDEMLLPLSGGRHRIELRFRRTQDRTIGGLISIVFGILLSFWWARMTGAPRGTATINSQRHYGSPAAADLLCVCILRSPAQSKAFVSQSERALSIQGSERSFEQYPVIATCACASKTRGDGIGERGSKPDGLTKISGRRRENRPSLRALFSPRHSNSPLPPPVFCGR